MDGTVRDYGARFFFDGKIPNLYFPIQDKGILFALDPLGRSETASLQASIAFATRIFELSGLKDTFPLRQLDLQAESAYPADVKIVNIEPSPYGLIQMGASLTVTVTLSYDATATNQLEIRNTSIIYSKGDDVDRIQSLQAQASANPVLTMLQKGTGEISIRIPVDLTGAQVGQRIRVDAQFNASTESGTISRSVDQLVQYTIGL